jgi:hypothetical protein
MLKSKNKKKKIGSLKRKSSIVKKFEIAKN